LIQKDTGSVAAYDQTARSFASDQFIPNTNEKFAAGGVLVAPLVILQHATRGSCTRSKGTSWRAQIPASARARGGIGLTIARPAQTQLRDHGELKV
jgi:hypothetical protein